MSLTGIPDWEEMAGPLYPSSAPGLKRSHREKSTTSAQKLRLTLKDLTAEGSKSLPERRPEQAFPCHPQRLLFGVMAQKDSEEVLEFNRQKQVKAS